MQKRAVQKEHQAEITGHTANCRHGCLNLQMGILVEACSCGCSSVNEHSAAQRTFWPLLPKRRSAGRVAISSGWPSVSENLKRASLLSLY